MRPRLEIVLRWTRWTLILLGLVAIAGTAAACDGLSPGDELDVGNALCTLGFLVVDPNGLYFATAGHCIHVNETASNPAVPNFGVGVFHFLQPETGSETDGSPGMDFALIKVDPASYGSLNPKMCGWDGPKGLYNDSTPSTGVETYGHGVGPGTAGDMLGVPTNARPGENLQTDDQAFYWAGANTPGDSGGAVMSDDGRALGVVTHLIVSSSGDNGGTRLQRGFQLAADGGFRQLRLVLAGEDPVKALAQMKANPPPPMPTTNGGSNATITASNTSTAPSNATQPSPSPSPSSAPPPSNGSSKNDSIAQAATTDGTAPDAPAKKTPGLAPIAAIAVAGALALARRKR